MLVKGATGIIFDNYQDLNTQMANELPWWLAESDPNRFNIRDLDNNSIMCCNLIVEFGL